LKWNDENTDPVFRKRAKAFVTWLKEADEDSSEDEDDNQDDDDDDDNDASSD
jgi:hypothetical protein